MFFIHKFTILSSMLWGTTFGTNFGAAGRPTNYKNTTKVMECCSKMQLYIPKVSKRDGVLSQNECLGFPGETQSE